MASRSALERLLQHLGHPQNLFGIAIRPQKSLPESRWASPGTSLGHFFEARGRNFHEQTSTNTCFQCSKKVAADVVFQNFWIGFSPILGKKKTMKNVMVIFKASRLLKAW